MARARAVNWTLLDHASDAPVAVGDLVSVDAGGMPIYSVLGLEGDRAVLRDDRHAFVQQLPLASFRWKGVAAP